MFQAPLPESSLRDPRLHPRSADEGRCWFRWRIARAAPGVTHSPGTALLALAFRCPLGKSHATKGHWERPLSTHCGPSERRCSFARCANGPPLRSPHSYSLLRGQRRLSASIMASMTPGHRSGRNSPTPGGWSARGCSAQPMAWLKQESPMSGCRGRYTVCKSSAPIREGRRSGSPSTHSGTAVASTWTDRGCRSLVAITSAASICSSSIQSRHIGANLGLSEERLSSITTVASPARGVRFRRILGDCWHRLPPGAERPLSTLRSGRSAGERRLTTHCGHSVPNQGQLLATHLRMFTP